MAGRMYEDCQRYPAGAGPGNWTTAVWRGPRARPARYDPAVSFNAGHTVLWGAG